MNSVLRKCGVSLASLLFMAGVPTMSSAANKTYTGQVSDAMCGAEHMEPGVTAAACTKDCVAKGTKYALVVGNKVYTLEGENESALGQLNKLAGKEAQVTGAVIPGDIIEVVSVDAAK